MKKNSASLATAAALVVLLGVLLPRPAAAQCEKPANASFALDWLMDRYNDYIMRFVTQEQNFIRIILTVGINAGQPGVQSLQSSLTTNLTKWWNAMFPALKDMTAELNVSQVDQSIALGRIVDAQLLLEEQDRQALSRLEARRRYAPSALACEIDTVGQAQAKAAQLSRELNDKLAKDDTPRQNNAEETSSETGTAAELVRAWEEYITYFCDPALGDQGCETPGLLPGGSHRDIGALLWGNRQTLDLSVPNNLTLLKAALRYMISPLASDPVVPTLQAAPWIDTPSGQQNLMGRHTESAYINTIYNVMAPMLAERAGSSVANPDGTTLNVKEMLAAKGLPSLEASNAASYREIQSLMSFDRYNNPQYVVSMLQDPVQIGREQNTLNAIRLQTMNDIFRRSEELLFMEAAQLGRDLDAAMPEPPVHAIRVK